MEISLRVFAALLSVTTLNYLLSLLSLVMFYLYFTHSDGCTENKVFISVNMLLCIAASVLSVLPHIQVRTVSCLGFFLLYKMSKMLVFSLWA